MMKSKIFTAVICAIVFIGACSKDKDTAPVVIPPPTSDSTTDSVPTVPPPVQASRSMLIAANLWKIDTIAFDTDKNGMIDSPVPGGFKPCDLDNTLKFNADSSGVFDEGPLKCSDSTAQTIPYVWYLASQDSIVNINGDLPGVLHGDIDILELTDSTLVMSKKDVPYTTGTANLIVALKK